MCFLCTNMVPAIGLEPMTITLEGCRSIQLSYASKNANQVYLYFTYLAIQKYKKRVAL